MLELHELKTGLRVRGLVAAGDVTIVAVEPHGDGIVNVASSGSTTVRSPTASDRRRCNADRRRVWAAVDLRRRRRRVQARERGGRAVGVVVAGLPTLMSR